MKIIIIVLGLILFVVAADLILRLINIRKEYIRKLGHFAFCACVFLLSYFTSARIIIIICLAFVLLLLAGRFFDFLPGIQKHKVDRKTLGEFYLPLSIAISAAWFLPLHLKAFQFGVLVLGLSDTAAEIAGITYGKHKIKFLGNKTWQGSTGFFIITLVIYLIFINSNFYWGLSISLLLAIIEAFLSFGLDNLILPILAAYLIHVLIG